MTLYPKIKNKINLNLFYSIRKTLSFGFTNNGGRNFLGRICVHHQGGGNKRLYNYIDFYRRLNNFGIICNIIKDSFRSAFIGCIFYTNGLISYIIIAESNVKNTLVYSGDIIKNTNCFNIGSAIPILNIPLFSIINNIELFPLSGSKLVRSAGVGAVLTGFLNNKAILKLSSGWQCSIDQHALATLGFVSNSQHKYLILKKAGRNRAMGIRPTVRGVAKNPCDHPHGGGEGKKSPPRAQVTPWGKFTKGTPTTNTIKDRLKRRLFKSIS